MRTSFSWLIWSAASGAPNCFLSCKYLFSPCITNQYDFLEVSSHLQHRHRETWSLLGNMISWFKRMKTESQASFCLPRSTFNYCGSHSPMQHWQNLDPWDQGVPGLLDTSAKHETSTWNRKKWWSRSVVKGEMVITKWIVDKFTTKIKGHTCGKHHKPPSQSQQAAMPPWYVTLPRPALKPQNIWLKPFNRPT